MTRTLRRCSLLAAPLALLFPAFPLRAAPAPTSAAPALARLQLKGRGELRIEADGRLVLVTSAEVRPLARLGTQAPRSAHLRAVDDQLVEAVSQVGPGGHTLLLRVTNDPPEVLFDEPTGPNEDGELTRHVEVTREAVRRWQATPAVARCDARPPLFLQRFDVATKTWAPIVGAVPAAPVLVGEAGLSLARPRRALRFSSASSDGHSESADRLGAPRELDDGDEHTAWIIGRGASTRGAFATARAPREVELIGLRVVAPPAPARLPAALVLVGGSPARASYRLPLAGGRAFRLPTPLKGACVSLVVDDSGSDELAIGEIELVAADDQAGGLEALAQAVASDGADAEGSAHSLQSAGLPGADAALGAIAAASATGRVRLLHVVAAHARALGESQLRALGVLLETAHGEERPVLVEIFASQGRAGLTAAARLLSDPSQSNEARADAIAILARLAPADAEAAALLFDRLGYGDRALALRALQQAAARATSVALDAARRLQGATTIRADLVAVFSSATPTALRPSDREALTEALSALGPVDKLPFELAARVLAAEQILGAPGLLAAAGQVLAHSPDPTLRRIAVTSLPRTDDPPSRLLLNSAATDGDAQVRQEALARLVATGASPTLKSLLLGRTTDPWPQVRCIAYEGLGASCDAEIAALLERQVFGKGADANGKARAAALAGFARCPGGSLEKIASAINAKQPIEVRERAAQLLGELGGATAGPLVTKALDRIFSHGGPELAQSAVPLLRALGRSGARRGDMPLDDDTLTVLRDAAADPFYPAIRIAAIEALSTACPLGAHFVFDRGDKNPEAAVQRASALARRRCGR